LQRFSPSSLRRGRKLSQGSRPLLAGKKALGRVAHSAKFWDNGGMNSETPPAAPSTSQSYNTISITRYSAAGPTREQEIQVIAETLVGLQVNGAELVTFACTPIQPKELALGFLLNEGLVDSLDEIVTAHVCASAMCVDGWLHHALRPSTRRILTSGCSGGTTFDDLSRSVSPVASKVALPAQALSSYLTTLRESARLYRLTRGVHTSGLFKDGTLVSLAEDVGRHNTLDKIRGDCALRGLDSRDGVLATTGRVSSEMLNKAARMGCPVVLSRTSATSLSIQLARAWNITLVGYIRPDHALVYSGAHRLERTPLPLSC